MQITISEIPLENVGTVKTSIKMIPPKIIKYVRIHAKTRGILWENLVARGSSNQATTNPIKTGDITDKIVPIIPSIFHSLIK